MKKIIIILMMLFITGCGVTSKSSGGSSGGGDSDPYIPPPNMRYYIITEEYNMSAVFQWRMYNYYDGNDKLEQADYTETPPTISYQYYYTYHTNGLPSLIRTYQIVSGNPEIFHRQEYFFDINNKIAEEYYYMNDNTQAYRKIIRNWDGNNVTANVYNWAGAWNHELYYVEVYNEDNHLLSKHQYLVAGDTFVASENYVYNDEKIQEYNKFDGTKLTHIEYSYDGSGNLIESDTFEDGLQISYTTYSNKISY